MAIDGMFLRGLVSELNGFLANARLHQISQCGSAEVLLTLRQPGRNFHLLLSADPAAPRAHLVDDDRPYSSWPTPFCMVLRKHLLPGRVLAIEQPGWERIMNIRFETRAGDGSRVERHLILEIMGRHSNLLLVAPESGLMLDGIRHVGAHQSRHREVMPGRPYIAPPDQGKKDPLKVEREDFLFQLRHIPGPRQLARAISEIFDGIGPEAGREIVSRAGFPPDLVRADLAPEDAETLWRTFREVTLAVAAGRISPWGTHEIPGAPAHFWLLPLTHLGLPGRTYPDLNALLCSYYQVVLGQKALAEGKARLQRLLEEALGKLEKHLAHQEEALAGAARAEEYRKIGELLLAQLAKVPPGAASVILEDYYNQSAPLEVELNPALSPEENAHHYFKMYQKGKKTAVQAEKRRAAAVETAAYYRSILVNLMNAENEADLEDIKDEMIAAGLMEDGHRGQDKKAPYKGKGTRGTKKKADVRRPAFLSVTAPDGTEILVGKNNRQNDLITMELAAPHNLWLHVKDQPGAHVIIRNKHEEIAEDTLLLALQLAAYYSKARSSSQVPVDYCLRRYVRKPKGARPGFVLYDHHKTAYITPDIEVINRLKRLG